MGLSSLFSRRDSAVPIADAAPGRRPPAAAPDSVQQARTRARHRLIGAAVLVGLGIVVFPLVFETEPRRVSIDIPIEIAKRGSPATAAAPRANEPRQPNGREVAHATPDRLPEPPSRSPAPVSEPVASSSKIITETAAEAGREVMRPTPKPLPAPPRPTVARIELPAETPRSKPTPPVAAKPPAMVAVLVKPPPVASPKPPPETRSAVRTSPSVVAGDAARAQLLLEGKDEAKAELKGDAKSDARPDLRSDPPETPTRYVVQVGAFADGAAAHDTRGKVERLGMKTYTQIGNTAAGPRTRVRVGPVATRAEAERLQAKLKAAGLPAVVLTL